MSASRPSLPRPEPPATCVPPCSVTGLKCQLKLLYQGWGHTPENISQCILDTKLASWKRKHFCYMMDLLKELLWPCIGMWCHFPKPTWKATKSRRSSRLGCWAEWLCWSWEVVSSSIAFCWWTLSKTLYQNSWWCWLLTRDSWLQKYEGQKPSADDRHRRCTASKALMWINRIWSAEYMMKLVQNGLFEDLRDSATF